MYTIHTCTYIYIYIYTHTYTEIRTDPAWSHRLDAVCMYVCVRTDHVFIRTNTYRSLFCTRSLTVYLKFKSSS